MSLAEDLAAAPKRAQYGTRCGFCTWFAGLDKRAKTMVIDAMYESVKLEDGSSVFLRHGSKLDEVWAKNGWTYSRGITQRHRNGQCTEWSRDRPR